MSEWRTELHQSRVLHQCPLPGATVSSPSLLCILLMPSPHPQHAQFNHESQGSTFPAPSLIGFLVGLVRTESRDTLSCLITLDWAPDVLICKVQGRKQTDSQQASRPTWSPAPGPPRCFRKADTSIKTPASIIPHRLFFYFLSWLLLVSSSFLLIKKEKKKFQVHDQGWVGRWNSSSVISNHSFLLVSSIIPSQKPEQLWVQNKCLNAERGCDKKRENKSLGTRYRTQQVWQLGSSEHCRELGETVARLLTSPGKVLSYCRCTEPKQAAASLHGHL